MSQIMSQIIAMSNKLVGEVIDMSFHRNGISGRGFWTILFKGTTVGGVFVATFFPKGEFVSEDGDLVDGEEACVAVLRLEDLKEGNAKTTWRGDNFHDELQSLVDGFTWEHDRNPQVEYDGAGREMTDRRGAIKAQKAKLRAK